MKTWKAKDIRKCIEFLKKHELPKLPCGCQINMDTSPIIIFSCNKHSKEKRAREQREGI